MAIIYQLTQAGDEIAPELSGLPGQEEEAEEPHDNGIHCLFRDLGIHLSHLRQIGGFGCPHGCSAHTHQDAGGHQGVESREELEGDVGGIAEHAADQGPLDRQFPDDQRGQEDAGDHQGGIDRTQRDCAQTILSVYGGLQIGRTLEWETHLAYIW